MNSAAQVDNLVNNWKQMGMTKQEIIVKQAEAMLGWPYVWGASGQDCTPAKRRYFMNRSSIGEKDRQNIIDRCQVLKGDETVCNGCKFYPNCARTRIQDCQGFEKEIHKVVGITLKGGGATSMYNDNSNWVVKGPISEMPKGQVCCVFQYNSAKDNMQHVGQHIGGGNVIHCSGTVKRGKITDKGWTHYAIPKGLEGSDPMPTEPTIRRGSRGDAVTELQTILNEDGYDLGKSGIDGIFGKATEDAVKAFQSAHGLKADGIVGPATWTMLLKVETEQPSAPVAGTYTVTISGLTQAQAEYLKEMYPEALVSGGGE